MHTTETIEEAFRLAEKGLSQAAIARTIGVSRGAVRDWLLHGRETVLSRPMRRSGLRAPPDPACPARCPRRVGLDEPAYAYLLGQYLGDGCVSVTGASARLRIACCATYPGILAECTAAMRAVVPTGRVGHIHRPGYVEVHAAWAHWPCLLPHGPGVKHERRVVLRPWQATIALDHHPGRFLRGLIHSDGCRCINTVHVGGRTYQYTRYLFSNRSTDIQGLFLEACRRLGISARPNNWNSLSVARSESVERLDRIVGPKT